MIKLAALGALGYAGYKYYQKSFGQRARRDAQIPSYATATGQRSDNATIQPARPFAS